jgi:hypothetical protein
MTILIETFLVRAILIMTILIMTILIMTIHITLITGDITCNVIFITDFITVIKKHL